MRLHEVCIIPDLSRCLEGDGNCHPRIILAMDLTFYKVYNLPRFNNNASVICPALNLPESDFAIVSIGILSDLGSELWVSSDSLYISQPGVG